MMTRMGWIGLYLAAFGATSASATDLICEGTATEASEAGILTMSVEEPQAPESVTSYRLTLAISGAGTKELRLNAALHTQVANSDGGVEHRVIPVASLRTGVDGVRTVKAGKQTTLLNGDGLWVIGFNEQSVQSHAGQPGILQLFIEPRHLSESLPAGVAQIQTVDCVAF